MDHPLFPLNEEPLDAISYGALRVYRLINRLRDELVDARCGVCCAPFQVSGDRVPFVRYTCAHGPQDRGAAYLQAA